MKVMAALLMSLALSGCSSEKPQADTTRVSVPHDVIASDDARERGREIFLTKCALCHGERADGNGVRSKGLSGKAADFTSPDWRARVTPEYVFRIVSTGKRGTSMPAWPTLSDAEKWDVIAYVLSVSEDGR